MRLLIFLYPDSFILYCSLAAIKGQMQMPFWQPEGSAYEELKMGERKVEKDIFRFFSAIWIFQIFCYLELTFKEL